MDPAREAELRQLIERLKAIAVEVENALAADHYITYEQTVRDAIRQREDAVEWFRGDVKLPATMQEALQSVPPAVLERYMQYVNEKFHLPEAGTKLTIDRMTAPAVKFSMRDPTTGRDRQVRGDELLGLTLADFVGAERAAIARRAAAASGREVADPGAGAAAARGTNDADEQNVQDGGVEAGSNKVRKKKPRPRTKR